MVTVHCIIDRIEEGVAVCVDDEGKVNDLPFYLFPAGCAEGSEVECRFDGNDLREVTLLSPVPEAVAKNHQTRLKNLLDKFRDRKN